jgi:hypothetical protein
MLLNQRGPIKKTETATLRLHLIALVMTAVSFSPACHGQTLNSKIATFLAGKVGVRVGGGGCAHAASEALRAAGAEFTKIRTWDQILRLLVITFGERS